MALIDDILAYYKLDGNSNDSVGSNDGTDTHITYSESNGKIGQGAGFTNSADNVIALPDDAALKPTGNFSLSLWIKTTSSTGYPTIFCSGDNVTATYYGFRLYLMQTTNVLMAMFNRGTGNTEGTDWIGLEGTVNTITDGNWHHIVITYDGTHVTMYHNGSQDVQADWTYGCGYSATTHPLIGAGMNNGSQFRWLPTNSCVDEVGLWGRALSLTEVQALYNSGAGFQYPFILPAQAGFLLNII